MEAVIMTGGKGMRMNPYTKVLPKGLLPIAEQPILEIIVKQLRFYGFTKITMACGYLAPLIKTYFGDGSRWSVDIQYFVEEKPLGTIGPLGLLKPFRQPFLVINCDVLTVLDYLDFYQFHCEGQSLLTIASQRKKICFDLGVLETEGDQVIGFVEKPEKSLYVSMGIYMMAPEAQNCIPRDQYFDVPDLIAALLQSKQQIRHFECRDFWMDVGQPNDYKRASEAFASLKHKLIPGDSE